MAKNYNRLALSDRVKIEVGLSHNKSYQQIAVELDRNKSSICREVTPWNRLKYKAVKAQQYAEKGASIRKKGKNKLTGSASLLVYIQEKLELRWSPEQISNNLKNQYPEQKEMQTSPETIYRYVYLHAKKSLREELTAQLRRQKKARGRPRSKDLDKRGKIPDAISIDERPEEVKGRQIAGHWEGDLVIGKDHKSAIGTLVERTTRAIIIVPLESTDATTVRESFEEAFLKIPQQMRKTMTYDNGKEMTQHTLFTENTKMKVYFCHPYSPLGAADQ